MTDPAVAHNVATHTKRAGAYDEVHRDIFNALEQERLRNALKHAVAAVESGGNRALDFGCGTGNLTRHLLDLGQDVTAADVTPRFLELVEMRFGVATIHLAGGELRHLPDGGFDLIAVYSVLHHVPDYLAAVGGLVAKLRPGGVLFLDHEKNDEYWTPTPELVAFRREQAAARTGEWWDPEHKRWQHLLRAAVTPFRHAARLQRLRGISREGDIHVWPHDHIEWDRIVATVEAAGATVVERTDYLNFSSRYDVEVWRRYRERCSDTTCLVARRPLAQVTANAS